MLLMTLIKGRFDACNAKQKNVYMNNNKQKIKK